MAQIDYLKKILATKAQEVAERRQRTPITQLLDKLPQAPAVRHFRAALEQRIQDQQPAIIAEIKRASPSKGLIRADFNPPLIAQQYQTGGATCLSVLTDEAYFQGHDDYLQQVRKVSALPILRKDFIIDPYQIYESRWLGADCILLIVAALSEQQIREYAELAFSLDLSVLIEANNAQELHIAAAVENAILAINNRNLHNFTTSLATTVNLIDQLTTPRLVVAASGIHNAADIQYLLQHNVSSFLIGESLMRKDDPGQALANLLYNVSLQP